MAIPEGIEYITECAFEGFDDLRSVVIPESVKRIGDRAFKGCRNLESVKFSDDSIVLGFEAFEGCPLNEETKELINKPNYVFIKGKGNIKDFYIGRFPVTQDLYEDWDACNVGFTVRYAAGMRSDDIGFRVVRNATEK